MNKPKNRFKRVETQLGMGTILCDDLENDDAYVVLLDKANGHDANFDIINNEHPFFNRLTWVDWSKIEKEKMIDIDGKEFSLSTIKEALREHVK